MPVVPESALEGWLADSLRGRRGPLAAATVCDGADTSAVLGADPRADFEIGSVSKALTGLLYADAISAGVVSHDSRVGELLDVGTGPQGALRVSDLATHRSGLPRLPAGIHVGRRTWNLWRHGANPYGDSLADLLAQVRGTRVGRRRFRYSNLGFELLGHAVASAQGVAYDRLLRLRLTEPLGLDHTYAAYRADCLAPMSLVGRSRGGRHREPWTGEALAPAGGIRATIADMATLTRALLDGTAPGLSALDPVARVAGAARIGAGWLVVPGRLGTVTLHNGRTGGFASWLGLARDRQSGVVVLAAASRPVDRLGMDLLDTVRGREV